MPALVLALVLASYGGCYGFARTGHLVVRTDYDTLVTGDQGIGGLPFAEWFAPLCWLEERFWALRHHHPPRK